MIKKAQKKQKQEEQDDDIVFEAMDETSADALKKLRSKLKVCNEERGEYLQGWQRSKADFINAKKENEERLRTVSDSTKSALITDMLLVVDSFEMAVGNKEAWESVDENWRKGVEYIYAQLLSILEENGLKPIDPQGKPFDPHVHSAVEDIVSEDKKDDGKVLGVMQKGYMLGDKVLRPAKVTVGRYSKE